MAAFDYNALRQQTLGSTQEEEAVTVNTRALIDKVLARYSGEHTTLRELLQNAADANASEVEVRFESAPLGEPPATFDLSDPKNSIKVKIRRMLVKNDGQAFREEDWQRLKRIAEGNPDETKIGAFGVGFYSVFSDCEEPFVSSGSEAMAFYWKGNQLFTKRSKLQNTDSSTTFLLEFREATELPDLKVLCKFLNSSLTFVKLQSISLFLDNQCLQRLEKKASPSSALQIPSHISPVTEDRMMKIAAVVTETIQIDAKYMNITQYRESQAGGAVGSTIRSLFSQFRAQPVIPQKEDNDLSEYTTKTIFLSVANATVHTFVDRKFATELERATKKPPPKVTQVAILTMSKAEHDASEQDAEIFGNIIPTNGGKVFIGFPTHQTTGIKAHISAHSVIPTVERENIDLNARIVKNWNVELLRIGGILARIVFHTEMGFISRQARSLEGSALESLYDHAVHVMNQFSFQESTPQYHVGHYILGGFWNCTKKSIEILSTKGVLPANQVRLSSDISFLENLPMLPPKLLEAAPEFFKPLIEEAILVEVTMPDVLDQLETKALTGNQITEFLNWAAKQRNLGKMDDAILHELLGAAVVLDEKSGLPIQLGNIKHVVNISKLAPDVLVPPDTLPFHLTKNCNTKGELKALGWTDLGVAEWLNFLCRKMTKDGPTDSDMCHDPQAAQQTLQILAKNWDAQSQERRDYMVKCLQPLTCVPTKSGMKRPGEAYFPTVKLFEDLPIVNVMGVKEKILIALGVRKTVDLKIVFERLMSESDQGGEKRAKWSHVDLVKYLVSVRDDIPKEDIQRLCNTPICKAEPSGSATASGRYYKVAELYEPNDHLRQLGLPILQWPGEWRSHSYEGKFLHKLGLRKFPNAAELVQLMAGKDRVVADAALTYFVVNYLSNAYQTQSFPMNIAFLPLDQALGTTGDHTRLVTPIECFSNPRCAILGFPILSKDLRPHADKFKVRQDPDMNLVTEKLMRSPPPSIRSAREQFGYMASRLGEIMPHHQHKLMVSPIVPVFDTSRDRRVSSKFGAIGPIASDISKMLDETKPTDVHSHAKFKYLAPNSCFLGAKDSQYAEVFDFVDFGHEANAFLLKCGSKNEPTTAEVAYLLVREPQRILDIFQGHSKYLSVLRTLAENFPTLRKDKELVREMKRSKFLLASIELPLGGQGDDADDQTIKEYQLASARQIVVSDDFVAYNLFKAELLVAPQEDILENFYCALGASSLVALVEEQYRLGRVIDTRDKAERLHKLLVERTGIFLHNNTEPVRHDARWIEKNIRVQFVEKINLRRLLTLDHGRVLSKEQDSTAAITEDSRGGKKVLNVTLKHQTFDVCQLLVNLILFKPKLHSTFLLDSLFTTDLLTLKARGFNVDRILKANAAEARQREQARLKRVEEQQKVIEAESQRYREQEAQRLKALAVQKPEGPSTHVEQHMMPGQFDSPSPPRVKALSDTTRPITSNFFKSLGRHLGFEETVASGSGDQSTRALLPPPKTPVSAPTPSPQPDNTPRKPTQPFVLKANLQNAIAASRPHDSNKVFSFNQTQEVFEQKSYCDSQHGHDLQFMAETPSSIKLYIARKVASKEEFLRTQRVNIHHFSTLLVEIAHIFDLPIHTMHIFYDEEGPTIAFNQSGALFFNYRYFSELHPPAPQVPISADALVYWFVVACHELAHNIVQVHNSTHSFWTESFVQMYYLKAIERVWGVAAGKTETQRLQITQGTAQAAPQQPPSYSSLL